MNIEDAIASLVGRGMHAEEAMDLLLAALEFLKAGTWQESRNVLDEYPALLRDEGDEALRVIREFHLANEEYVAALVVERHRVLLRASRESEPTVAFAEQAATGEAKYAVASTPLRELAAHVLFEQSAAEQCSLIQQYPELISEAGLAALEELVAFRREMGDSPQTRAWERFLTVARRASHVGIEEAFTEAERQSEEQSRQEDSFRDSLAKRIESARAALDTTVNIDDPAGWDGHIREWDSIIAACRAEAGWVPTLVLSWAGFPSILRYRLSHEKEDLDRAAELWDEVIIRRDADDETLDLVLTALAGTYALLYRAAGDSAARDRAIELFEESLEDPKSVSAVSLAELAVLLEDRHIRDGDAKAEQFAIGIARRVSERASRPGAPETDQLAVLYLPDRLRSALANGEGSYSLGPAQRDGETEPGMPRAGAVRPELQAPLEALLNSRSWRAISVLIQSHPEILENETLEHLRTLAQLATVVQDTTSAARLQRCRDFLLRCREAGPDQSIREFEAQDTAIDDIIRKIIESGSAAELIDVLNSRRDLPATLVAAQAESFLTDLRADFIDRGDHENVATCDFKAELVRSALDGNTFVATREDHFTRHQTWFVRRKLVEGREQKNLELLNDAVATGERIIADSRFMKATAKYKADMLRILGLAYSARFAVGGDENDLIQALARLKETTNIAPRNSQAWIDSMVSFGAVSGEAGNHWSTIEFHADAVKINQELLGELDSASPDRAITLYNLANALNELAEYNSDAAGDAVELGREAVALTERESVHLASRLNGLGRFLRRRALRSGEAGDLVRATRLHRRALAISDTLAERAEIRLSLGNSLRELFEFTADAGALEEAVSSYEEALGTPGLKPLTRARLLSGQANALSRRYIQRGVIEDLEMAQRSATESLDLLSEPGPELFYALMTLGLATTALNKNLDEEIRLLRFVTANAAEGSNVAEIAAHNLGTALVTRYRLYGDESAADEALALLQSPKAHESAHSVSSYVQLGELLVERYRRDSTRAEDLDKGIGSFERACRISGNSTISLSAQAGLARARVHRWKRQGDEADRVAAVLNYRSVTSPAAYIAPTLVVHSAREWAEWALERGAWQEAVDATDRGIAALNELVRIQLRRSAKAEWIAAAESLPALACYARWRTRDLAGAVLKLETGRALLLSEALERNRIDLEALAAGEYEQVAQRYIGAAARWSQLTSVDPYQTLSPSSESLAEARAQLDAAVEAVRRVPGYEAYGLAPTIGDLGAIPRDEAIVYVMAASTCGLALLLLPNGQVRDVELADLTRESVARHVGAWREAYLRRGEDRQQWWDTVDKTTRWLWDAIVGPFRTEIPDQLSVTLVPGGLLGLLPLHAAWHLDSEGNRHHLLDDTTVRYAPNARALAHARQRSQTPGATLLAIENPLPSSHPSLPGAQSEVDEVCRHFPVTAVTRLPGPKAQLPDTLDALTSCDVLHFCCHGEADSDQPLNGGLDLANDARLTVGLVMSRRIEARLAVLSACESGLVAPQLSDEVVGLPAAFLEAGAAGVVGTLWSVTEPATIAVVSDFYDRWRNQPADPAAALCAAQTWARNASYQELHQRFPSVDAFNPAGIPEAALELWKTAQPLRRTSDWAAMAFVGD